MTIYSEKDLRDTARWAVRTSENILDPEDSVLASSIHRRYVTYRLILDRDSACLQAIYLYKPTGLQRYLNVAI